MTVARSGRHVSATWRRTGLDIFLNMLVLVLLVDRAGYPHLWVQGAMILVLAVMLFLMQKLWVFREGAGGR